MQPTLFFYKLFLEKILIRGLLMHSKLSFGKRLMLIFLILFGVISTALVSYALLFPCQRLWPMRFKILLSLVIIIFITLIGITIYLRNCSLKQLHFFTIINFSLITVLGILSLIFFAKHPHWDTVICTNAAYHLYPHFNWHDVTGGEHYYATIEYPNNLALIYFEAIIMKILAILKVSFTIRTVYYFFLPFNIFFLLSAVGLTFQLIKKHCQYYVAVLFTVLVLLTSALFPSLTVFYTDYPAMLIICLMLTCYDNFITKHQWRYAIWLLIISILGSLIKFNITIVLIGISIHYMITHHWTKALRNLLLLWLLFGLTIGNIRHYEQRITNANPSEFGMPVIHWPLMSLNPSGGYTSKGANYTDKLKSHYDNTHVAQIETKQYFKIITTKPQRVWQALQAKISWVYSEGTYQSLKFCLVSKTAISKIAQFFYGNKRNYFIYWCSAYNLALWFLIIVGIWLRLFELRFGSCFQDAGMISLFGNMLFLLIWEANSRYMFAFLPIMLTLASITLTKLIAEFEH